MCRILAITNFEYNKHKPLIDGLFGLAVCGKVPRGNTPGHQDGWGVGYYTGKNAKVIKSGKSILDEKNRVYTLLEKINKTPILILHLRKSAWKDTNTTANSHPFKSKRIIFCHNGTIFDYKKLKINHKMANRKPLDSEVYFEYFVDFIAENTVEKGFMKCVGSIRKHNDYSSLTCVFSDGDKLYAYRGFTKRPGYYTLYKAKQSGSVIICSEPLKNIKWKLLPKNKLSFYIP